ncbi:MAG: hypothetical protein K8S55_07065 [Phycisphaerae bacterium]|nr:hypothetical protein [Phycisphaerae bacterium]
MSWINRDLVVACLKELSDRAIQERLWLPNEKSEQSSFEESVCQLFDDSGLGDRLEKPGVTFSEDADSLLRNLDTKLQAIDAMRVPIDIINDPRLDQVRSLAKEILSHIHDR